MNLQLVIPDLFWPESSQQEIYSDLSLPRLEKILSKSKQDSFSSDSLEAWLCRSFAINKQQSDWPIAPIMLQSDSGNTIYPGSDFWMRADPVHLRIEQNHILLADSQAFKISAEESQQLVQIINRSLNDSNIQLLALQPTRWYLRCTQIPKLETHTLSKVTCKNINNYLAMGAEGAFWNMLFNEIQMILHENPINQQRESVGELPINSVWFWGGGIMPQTKIESIYSHVWCNDNLAKVLAFHSTARWEELPLSGDDFLKKSSSGNHLIVLDSLYGKAKYRDAYGWRETLKEMEKKWFSPLYNALTDKKISQIDLTVIRSNATAQNFRIMPSDLWKFWRSIKSMTSLSVA